MRTTIPKKAPVLLLASVLMMGTSASATTIYDNSVTDKNLRFGPTTEFGDEIVFAGTERVLTNFSFEFWALNNGTTNAGGFSQSAAVRLRFYLNDGPPAPISGYSTPGSIFYENTFSITTPTFRSTLNYSGTDFSAGGLAMPVFTNMTWTVQFSGLDADDTAGLDVFYPPEVGTSPAQQNNRLDDYWELSDGTWALKTNSVDGVGVDMSFAAKFDATVPEPSTVVLGVLGGLGLLLVGRRFIKASE